MGEMNEDCWLPITEGCLQDTGELLHVCCSNAHLFNCHQCLEIRLTDLRCVKPGLPEHLICRDKPVNKSNPQVLIGIDPLPYGYGMRRRIFFNSDTTYNIPEKVSSFDLRESAYSLSSRVSPIMRLVRKEKYWDISLTASIDS